MLPKFHFRQRDNIRELNELKRKNEQPPGSSAKVVSGKAFAGSASLEFGDMEC